MNELCTLCRQRGTTRHKLVNHHYRGRKQFPLLTMKVHDGTCHRFADFVTAHYIEKGIVEQLYPKRIIYLYHRVMSMRDGGRPIFDEPL